MDVWIRLVSSLTASDEDDATIVWSGSTDWLGNNEYQMPVELADHIQVEIAPGKVFRWKILREVLLRHLDEIKNLELVDLFYNPKAKPRDDLEEKEDGMEG